MSTEALAIPKTIQVAAPEGAELLTTADKALEEARAVVIDSQDMAEIANEELVSIKRKAKALDEQRKAIVDPLNLAVKNINALFKPALERLDTAEGIVKTALINWDTEQQRIAALAKAKAEKDAAEARERARRDAADALQQAAEAEDSGDTVAAETFAAMAVAAEQTAELVVAAPAVAAPVRLAGTSIRKTWKARLPENDEQKLALLRFIVANPQYINLVEVSAKECNKIASALKANMKIDGLTAYEDRNLAASTR